MLPVRDSVAAPRVASSPTLGCVLRAALRACSVDQPIGTGWSFSDNAADTLQIVEEVMMGAMLRMLQVRAFRSLRAAALPGRVLHACLLSPFALL